jgi:hypothetical protein
MQEDFSLLLAGLDVVCFLLLGSAFLLLLLSIPDLPVLALIRWTWVLARLHFFNAEAVDEAGWENISDRRFHTGI